ncbi:MAG: RecX family transcriptional regulator [Prevotellaceae bacterium]|jgi:regulatory protein|nr:RecX family transcriptional regulator [Prevotellaceae bacterium]
MTAQPVKKQPTPGDRRSLSAEQALARLQQRCSRAEQCPSDVRKKLQDWGVPEKEIPAIIKTLQAQGFIDEARYARAFVRDKYGLAHWGTVKIKQVLYAKKIPPDTIADALQEIDRAQYKADLLRLLRRKKATLKDASPAAHADRLLRFALGRGYEYDVALETIAQIDE